MTASDCFLLFSNDSVVVFLHAHTNPKYYNENENKNIIKSYFLRKEMDSPVPYQFGAKLFLQNLLLGFVESACVLLPSALPPSSNENVDDKDNNNNNNVIVSAATSSSLSDHTTSEYYTNTLRSLLTTLFNQGIEQQSNATATSSSSSSARNHKQKSSLIVADHEVVNEVTFPAPKLAAFPVNEARLVPSILAPSVESLRTTLSHRLAELGLSLTNSTTTNNNNLDQVISIARQLSCAAFYLDDMVMMMTTKSNNSNKRKTSTNESNTDNNAIETFRKLSTIMDEIFLEEDLTKKGKLDAKRIGRAFDFLLRATFEVVSKSSLQQQEEQEQPQEQHQDIIIKEILSVSTPWRLALHLFVQTASSFFSASSFERYLSSEYTEMKQLLTSSASSSTTTNGASTTETDWLSSGFKLTSTKILVTIRATLLVSVFGEIESKTFGSSFSYFPMSPIMSRSSSDFSMTGAT